MAAGSTYTPIATTTLGSNATSYTFSSIPSTYTDLIIVANHTSSVGVGWFARFNGDNATNYSMTYVGGNGSAAESVRETNATCTRVGNAYPTLGTTIIQIQNYSNTTTYKTQISRTNNSSNFVAATVGLWRSTAAINSVTLLTNTTDTFQTGSTFTLYGIQAA